MREFFYVGVAPARGVNFGSVAGGGEMGQSCMADLFAGELIALGLCPNHDSRFWKRG